MRRGGRSAALVVAVLALVAGCGGGSAGPRTAASPSPAGSTSSAEGDGHETQPAAQPAPLRKGERFTTLDLPGGAYEPSAPDGGSDDYHCFLIDPHLIKDAFITGVEVLPGQPAIVHHAILFRVEPAQVATAELHDAHTPGRGWTCFGNSDIPAAGDGSSVVSSLDSAPWLAGWAPGSGESVFGRGTGVRVAKGSRIVLQVHYNLRALDEATGPDTTRVRLRLTAGSARLEPVKTMLIAAPVELPCTDSESGPLCDRNAAIADLVRRFGPEAGQTVAGLQLLCGGSLVAPRSGDTQHCDRRVGRRMVVRAVAGHMHLLGRSIQVTLDPGRPDQRMLLDRKVWDFDNQKATPLARPVTVRPGQTLRVTCTHDASLRALVPELQRQQPRYVTWGDGTSDEMCLGIVLYTDS